MEGGVGLRKPLQGVRVLAVEHFRAGPTASLLLADFGAEVIKVEPPRSGELGRSIFINDGQGRPVPLLTLSLHRNKKSITLNLRSERGRELFKRLVELSDVVLENMRPGVMENLGLGYSELKKINPGLIYASISGYGHLDIYQSPYWDWPAMDPLAQAQSGFMYSMGRETDPPWYNSTIIADTVPSMLAAFGVLLALRQRDRTGEGQHVDISMYDAMVFLNNYRITCASISGARLPRKPATSAPMGAYRAKDGYFALAVAGEPIWQRFCKAIGRPDLITHPELRDGVARARNEETILRPVVEGWARDKSVAEVCRIFREHDIPAAPVQDELSLLNCPHLKARRMLIEMAHESRKVTVVGNPVKLSAVPEEPPAPPPEPGQHNVEIFRGLLKLDETELKRLQDEGVI